MLKAPYLLLGFGFAAGTPNAAAVIRDIELHFPAVGGPPTALGKQNVFLIGLRSETAGTDFETVCDYLAHIYYAYGSAFSWFVQLCERATFSGR